MFSNGLHPARIVIASGVQVQERMKAMQEAMQRPEVQAQMQEMQVAMANPQLQQRLAAMRDDPVFKPAFEDIQQNGMGALTKYMNDPGIFRESREFCGKHSTSRRRHSAWCRTTGGSGSRGERVFRDYSSPLARRSATTCAEIPTLSIQARAARCHVRTQRFSVRARNDGTAGWAENDAWFYCWRGTHCCPPSGAYP